MKKLLYILLAICSVVVTGCLETKDDFTVNPDGSGKVVHELTLQPMNLGALGGGGGLNMGGAEQPGGQTPDPLVEMKKSVKGILDQSEGVDTWKDVFYERTPDGRTYFKGTAYFSDINDLTLGTGQMSADMGLRFSRDASGRIVIEIKDDEEAQDAEPSIPRMSEAELNQQLAEARQQYNTMGKPMMQMMLSSFKSEVIFRLPGAIQEISNFQKVDASTVSLTIDGAKLFAAMDRMMQDDAFMKEQIRTGNDPFSGGGNEMLNEMLFGEKGPIRVVVASPTQPLFDYNAEMAAAKANYDQMIKDIGLEGVQSGTTGFSFPGEAEDLPKSEVKGRIVGTDVTLDKAELQGGLLSIYAGDSWHSNPSLLVFLFLEEGTSPEGKTFSVDPAGGSQSRVPHVHCRWRDPGSQEIKSEIVMDGYALELKFDQAVGGVLSGSIQFSVPGKDTDVAGHFKVNVEDPDAGDLVTVEVPADAVEDDITLITKSPFGGDAMPIRPKVAIPALPPDATVPGRTIPLIAPEGTGDSNVRVAGARLVRYSNFELGVLPLGQRDGYTLSLIADLPVPAVKIAGGDVIRAVADNGVSLLPKRQWDRKIRFARLSKDGKTAIFDIKLQLPDQSVLGLDELSGTLEYETASGVKEVDLGPIDFKSGATGAGLGAKISSIEVDPYGNNPTIVGLAVQTTPESVRSVEVYDGAEKLEVTRRGHLSVGGTTIIKFSVGSKLPSRARIVLNILEQSEKNELSFRITRISLAGQPMR